MYDRPVGTYLNDLSLYRCDQCTRCKNVCDRVLPSCAYCSKRNIKCTLNRPIQRKSFSTQPRQSYLVKNKKFVEINHEEIRFKFQLEKSDYNFKVIPMKVFKEVESGPTAIVRTTFNSVKKRSRLSNLLVLLNFPQLDRPNPGLAVCLLAIQKFNLFSTQFTFAPNSMRKVPNTAHQAHKLFTELFNLYFRHVNPFLPLFEKETFFRVVRSKFLVSAILLRGYYFLKPDQKNEMILEYLELELYEQFQRNKFQISLGSVQALLVMYSGIEVDWVNFAENSLLQIAMKMGLSLGIDKKYLGRRNDKLFILERERILAYAALQQCVSRDGWLDPSLVQSLVYAELKDASILSCGVDAYNLSLNLLAQFFIETAACQYEVVKTREKVATGKIETVDLHSFIATTVHQLHFILQRILMQMQQIKYNSTEVQAKVEFTTQIIQFHHHLFVFRAYSLPVHYSKYNEPPTHYKKSFDPNLHKSLETSAQVLKFGCNVISLAPPLSVIPYVTQAFLFMLRYRNYHSDPYVIQNLVDESYKGFDFLIQRTTNPLLAKLNLSVVNALKDYSNLQAKD